MAALSLETGRRWHSRVYPSLVLEVVQSQPSERDYRSRFLVWKMGPVEGQEARGSGPSAHVKADDCYGSGCS